MRLDEQLFHGQVEQGGSAEGENGGEGGWSRTGEERGSADRTDGGQQAQPDDGRGGLGPVQAGLGELAAERQRQEQDLESQRDGEDDALCRTEDCPETDEESVDDEIHPDGDEQAKGQGDRRSARDLSGDGGSQSASVWRAHG